MQQTKKMRKEKYLKLGFLFTVAVMAIFKSINLFFVNDNELEMGQVRSKDPLERNLLNERKNEAVAEAQINFKLLHKQPQDCSPHRHFAYIKTHKTGSTTVYKIFSKYAFKHALKIGLKAPNPFLGGYPGHIKEEFLFLPEKNKGNTTTLRPVKKGEDFVLIDHFRFNHTLLKSIMSQQTLFVSVARQPWGNFQSAFHYYYSDPQPHHLRHVTCFSYPFFHVAHGRHVSIRDYILFASKRLNRSIPWFFRSKNYQSFDLGLDPLLEDENEIKKAVEELGKQIDLMMITDYMDESMILLKDKFCMSWHDILFLNDGSKHQYIPKTFDEDTTVMNEFRKIYKLDLMMYDYFNKTLWEKVDAYGREKMERDLQKLRTFRNQFKAQTEAQAKYKPNEHQHPQHSASQDDFNHRMFNQLHNNYNKDSLLTGILRQKISRQDSRLNNEQVNALADYMFKNKGSCPV